MTGSSPHKRLWFSPHGTEWEAESYEEALEMERDSLVEQLKARPSRVEVEKRVEWWITDFHFKPPELATDAYWKMMAREIAEYAVPNPDSR